MSTIAAAEPCIVEATCFVDSEPEDSRSLCSGVTRLARSCRNRRGIPHSSHSFSSCAGSNPDPGEMKQSMPTPLTFFKIAAVGMAFATNFVPSSKRAVCPAFGKFELETAVTPKRSASQADVLPFPLLPQAWSRITLNFPSIMTHRTANGALLDGMSRYPLPRSAFLPSSA